MTREQALKIAILYQDKYGFNTTIDDNAPARFYNSIEFIKGPSWAIEAALPPSNFEGSDTITYIISVEELRVKYIINSSGFPKLLDKSPPSFTNEELKQLRNIGFDIKE